jgi:hypothetical protein
MKLYIIREVPQSDYFFSPTYIVDEKHLVSYLVKRYYVYFRPKQINIDEFLEFCDEVYYIYDLTKNINENVNKAMKPISTKELKDTIISNNTEVFQQVMDKYSLNKDVSSKIQEFIGKLEGPKWKPEKKQKKKMFGRKKSKKSNYQ